MTQVTMNYISTSEIGRNLFELVNIQVLSLKYLDDNPTFQMSVCT